MLILQYDSYVLGLHGKKNYFYAPLNFAGSYAV